MTYSEARREIELLHERVCPALSEPTRMLILYALQEKALNVSELTEALQVPQSTVSRHLAVLRGRHLVHTKRQGNAIYYSLATSKIIQVLDLMRGILHEQMQDQSDLAAEIIQNSNQEAKE